MNDSRILLPTYLPTYQPTCVTTMRTGRTHTRDSYHHLDFAHPLLSCQFGQFSLFSLSLYTRTPTVAGDSCQFEASDVCSNPVSVGPDDAIELFDPTYALRDEDIPFCVNHGICYSAGNEHFCLCGIVPGSEMWTGKRCEIFRKEPGYVSPAPTASLTDTWAPTIDASYTEFPTVTPWPTYAITPEPTASEPVVRCGDLECR